MTYEPSAPPPGATEPPPPAPAPMGIGRVLDVGVGIMRRHWAVLLLLSLLLVGPGMLLSTAVGLRATEVVFDTFLDPETGLVDPDIQLTDADTERLLDALWPYLLASLVAGLFQTLGTLAFSAVVAADYHARVPSMGAVLRTVLARVPSVLGFVLLTSLVVVGIALAGSVAIAVALLVLPASGTGGPGIFLALVAAVAMAAAIAYLSLRWTPAYPAMVEEGLGVKATFQRSWHLSADNVLRIIAILLLGLIATSLISGVLGSLLEALLGGVLASPLGLDAAVTSTIALSLAAVIVAPIAAVLVAVLYFDLRARRDVPGSVA